MVLPPVVVPAGGVVPVVEEPPAGTVLTGQGPVADVLVDVAPAVPVAAPAWLPVVPAWLPVAAVPLFGLAAVPVPVPSVVAGTHVTGDMPAGFALPWVPLAPGAGVTPPGVCVIGWLAGWFAPGVAVPVVPTFPLGAAPGVAVVVVPAVPDCGNVLPVVACGVAVPVVPMVPVVPVVPLWLLIVPVVAVPACGVAVDVVPAVVPVVPAVPAEAPAAPDPAPAPPAPAWASATPALSSNVPAIITSLRMMEDPPGEPGPAVKVQILVVLVRKMAAGAL
ncbi:MAG TPA: hypothetical protein VE998_08355 [Terriglobales bacterium]|nr:hypothetical protein [Terriglobales bacterium]